MKTARKKTCLEPVAPTRPANARLAPTEKSAATGRFLSKYDPAHCAAIIEHMSTGASATSFAATIGVRPETLRKWAEQHEEFAEAKDLAFARCQSWWESKLREGLFDRVESTGSGKDRSMTQSRLNSNVARLVMQNLFAWSDRQMSEVFDRRLAPEEAGIAPYTEWETADLRALNALMGKYRRGPVPGAAPIEDTERPAPRRRNRVAGVDDDDGLVN